MINIIFKSNLLIALLFVVSGCSKQHLRNNDFPQDSILIHAKSFFDGYKIIKNRSILIVDGKIAQIDTPDSFKTGVSRVINLDDATVLPGIIELHAHLKYKNIPAQTVLKHGITTIRDLGGPVHQPVAGKGDLRILTSGPIITAVGGYPIPSLGAKNIAIAVETEKQARQAVQRLVKGGAVVIKVALEPGGESGAPWSSHHGHGTQHHVSQQNHNHHKNVPSLWPLLSTDIVKVIVDEAHKLNRKVTAHIGEVTGAEIAINAGVDEWAHLPCAKIPVPLLKKAVEQKVKIVTTIDTLSKCSGIMQNIEVLTHLGADFLYGAEIAHPDIPWGVDGQELMYMKHKMKMSALEVLSTATAKAGKHLNIPKLGTLQVGAPADIIAVKGNALENFKYLEHPDLVISGGKVVVNNFVKIE